MVWRSTGRPALAQTVRLPGLSLLVLLLIVLVASLNFRATHHHPGAESHATLHTTTLHSVAASTGGQQEQQSVAAGWSDGAASTHLSNAAAAGLSQASRSVDVAATTSSSRAGHSAEEAAAATTESSSAGQAGDDTDTAATASSSSEAAIAAAATSAGSLAALPAESAAPAAQPVVESISPAHAPREGGTPLLVQGRGFGGAGARLQAAVGGVPCAATRVHSATALSCLLPPGAGRRLPVSVAPCSCPAAGAGGREAGDAQVQPLHRAQREVLAEVEEGRSLQQQLPRRLRQLAGGRTQAAAQAASSTATFTYSEDLTADAARSGRLYLAVRATPLLLTAAAALQQGGSASVLLRSGAELNSESAHVQHNAVAEAELAQLLPAADWPQRYNSCALVGKHGVLLGSYLGELIDAHQAIWRMDNCPTTPHRAAHVGARTTFQVLAHTWAQVLLEEAGKSRGQAWWADGGTTAALWEPASYAAAARLLAREEPPAVAVLSREVVSLAEQVAQEVQAHVAQELGGRAPSGRASSLLVAAVAALQVCGSVDVYGAFPRCGSGAPGCRKSSYFDDYEPSPGQQAQAELDRLALTALAQAGHLNTATPALLLPSRDAERLPLVSPNHSSRLAPGLHGVCDMHACQPDCNGNGAYRDGSCECYAAYGGADCSHRLFLERAQTLMQGISWQYDGPLLLSQQLVQFPNASATEGAIPLPSLHPNKPGGEALNIYSLSQDEAALLPADDSALWAAVHGAGAAGAGRGRGSSQGSSAQSAGRRASSIRSSGRAVLAVDSGSDRRAVAAGSSAAGLWQRDTQADAESGIRGSAVASTSGTQQPVSQGRTGLAADSISSSAPTPSPIAWSVRSMAGNLAQGSSNTAGPSPGAYRAAKPCPHASSKGNSPGTAQAGGSAEQRTRALLGDDSSALDSYVHTRAGGEAAPHRRAGVPLRSPGFGRCALVGNSGTLLHTRAGAAIDAADLVIRFNQGPTAGFEAHVGARTDLEFLNKAWASQLVQGVKRTSTTTWTAPWGPWDWRGAGAGKGGRGRGAGGAALVLVDMVDPATARHRASPIVREREAWWKAAYARLRAEHPAVPALPLAPHFTLWVARTHARLARAFRAAGLGAYAADKPMSGFYAVLLAMQVCERVDVYGFSPWRGDAPQGQPRDPLAPPYHYWDGAEPRPRAHAFDLADHVFELIANTTGFVHVH